jgi:predicted phage terminase large subunit-like protein
LAQILKLRAKTDPFAFTELIYGYHADAHHREMVDFVEQAYRDRQHSVVLEPRGFAKSSHVTTGWTTQQIAKNHNLRVGLFSKTTTAAEGFSRGIRHTVERNPHFREMYGHLVSDVQWTNEQWLLADSRWVGSNYSTVFAAGAGKQAASKRFDLIICDDIIDQENVQTIDQLENVKTWFWKTVYPCLAKDGVIIVVGTRWGVGDLYEDLITPKDEGGKGWRSLVRSALIADETQPLKYRSLWPEEFSVERLLAMRSDQGSAIFAAGMLNDVSGLAAGNIFNPDDFQYFKRLPEGHEYTIRMGVDLASSTKERADYTARVTTAEDEEGNFYVLSYHRDKIATGHSQFVVDGWTTYPNMAAVMIEKVQYQSTLIEELMRDHSKIPVIAVAADKDKTTRGRAVAAKYQSHKVFHHVSLKDSDFESELTTFNPPRGHDDLVDALGYSMDLGGHEFSFAAVKVA